MIRGALLKSSEVGTVHACVGSTTHQAVWRFRLTRYPGTRPVYSTDEAHQSQYFRWKMLKNRKTATTLLSFYEVRVMYFSGTYELLM